MNFDHPVISSLLPVVLLILVGFVAGRAKLVRPEAVRDLSNLVFLVLTQALLFRTMSSVHLEKLDMRPVFQYFLVAGSLFFIMLMVYGRDSRASVLALASIFSNTLMIGVPLVGLAYGQLHHRGSDGLQITLADRWPVCHFRHPQLRGCQSVAREKCKIKQFASHCWVQKVQARPNLQRI